MGGRGPRRRKKNLAKHKEIGKSRRTRHYQRDIDQIIEDLEPQNLLKLKIQPLQEDLPGLGQFYCAFCAMYCVSQHALDAHQKGKQHKKRVKISQEEPYTIKDSLKFGGLG